LRNSYQFLEGLGVLCGCFWVAKPFSTKSELAKTSKVCLLEMLQTTNKVKKNFFFFRAKIFRKKNLILNDQSH
jgi:hypothetical protein